MLENKKLKIWSPHLTGNIAVFQDGTASDSDATVGFKFDNGFKNGGNPSSSDSNNSRIYITNIRIRNDYDNGHVLTFTVEGDLHWALNAEPSLAIVPNSKIEFFANVPDHHDITTYDWHLNEQSGQVRYFIGWVETINATPSNSLAVTVRGGFYRSNDVRIVRDAAQGIRIPKIAFNLETNSSDFFYSVKRISPSSVATGGPVNIAEYHLSIKEILQYLEAEYASELNAKGIIPGESVFHASDLTLLTTKPPPIILDDVGFGEAVKLILQNVPDVRLIIDPRTQLWRIIPVFKGIKDISFNCAIDNVGFPATGRITLLDGLNTSFSATPGEDGNRFRLISKRDPSQTVELTVDSLYAATILRTAEYIDGQWFGGATIYPIYGDSLDTLPIDFDNSVEADSLSLSEDLLDTYSQVRITSVHQVTESKTGAYDPTSTASYGHPNANTIVPAHNAAFEAFWAPGDQDRASDFGSSGGGINTYKTDISGTGGRTRIFFAFEDSAYAGRHVASEWVGTSLWVLTIDNLNHRPAKLTYRIHGFVTTSDIGDGRPGAIVTIEDLAASLLDTYPNFYTKISAPFERVADKFAMSASFSFPTTLNENQRASVGMLWTFVDTQAHAQGTSPHLTTCTVPQITAIDGSDSSRRQLGLSPHGQYPLLNNTPLGQFEILATGGIGAFHVWRRSFRTSEPLYDRGGGQRCDLPGWISPRAIEAEWETTTTEVRSAVCPQGGHGGIAHTSYNIGRTRDYTANHWFNNSQNAFYQELACRLWNLLSSPHYTGSVTLIGVKEWGAWLDLSTRVSFYSGLFPNNAAAQLTRFWAPIWTVELDISNDAVIITFDNKSALSLLAVAVFEDYLIKGKTAIRDIEAEYRKLNELPQCLLAARQPASNPGGCNTGISHGSRNTFVAINTNNKDNWLGGSSEIGAGSGTSAGAGSGTHGFSARETGFRDLAGQSYLITEYEGIVPASVENGVISQSPSSLVRPYGAAQQAQSSAIAALAMWGIQPIVQDPPLFSSLSMIGEAGGNVTYQSAHTSMVVNEYVGGELHVIDYRSDLIRGAYKILSNTSSSIVVEWDGKELPNIGTPLRVWKQNILRPDPESFENTGIVVIDSVGQVGIFDTSNGKLHAGRQVGNFVIVDATKTLTIQVGPTIDTGTVKYDGGTLLDKFGSSSGSKLLGFQDPNGNTVASDVHAALSKLFEWAVSEGYSETFGAPILGDLDFSNPINSGLI